MHRYLIITASILVLAATNTSTAWAGWGCGFRWPGLASDRNGSVWALPTMEKARQAAMRLCKQTQNGCFVTNCREGIDTEKQAHAVWPFGGAPAVNCFGSGCEKNSSSDETASVGGLFRGQLAGRLDEPYGTKHLGDEMRTAVVKLATASSVLAMALTSSWPAVANTIFLTCLGAPYGDVLTVDLTNNTVDGHSAMINATAISWRHNERCASCTASNPETAIQIYDLDRTTGVLKIYDEFNYQNGTHEKTGPFTYKCTAGPKPATKF